MHVCAMERAAYEPELKWTPGMCPSCHQGHARDVCVDRRGLGSSASWTEIACLHRPALRGRPDISKNLWRKEGCWQQNWTDFGHQSFAYLPAFPSLVSLFPFKWSWDQQAAASVTAHAVIVLPIVHPLGKGGWSWGSSGWHCLPYNLCPSGQVKQRQRCDTVGFMGTGEEIFSIEVRVCKGLIRENCK